MERLYFYYSLFILFIFSMSNSSTSSLEILQPFSHQVWFITLPGTITALPSVVQSDGKPFLFGNRPLIVSTIAENSAKVKIIDHAWKSKDYTVVWEKLWPKLYQGCMVLTNDGSSSSSNHPFSSTQNRPSRSDISLVSPSWYRLDTLDIAKSILWDVRGDNFYFTLREEGGFRLMWKPKDNNTRLAIKREDTWDFALDSREALINAYIAPWEKDLLQWPYYRWKQGELLELEQVSYSWGKKIFRQLTLAKRIKWEFGEINWISGHRHGDYHGMFNGTNIDFFFDFEKMQVPVQRIKNQWLFLNNQWEIITPISLRGHKLMTEGLVNDLPGFPWVDLIQLDHRNDWLYYTDGISLFHFQMDQDTTIARYQKEWSQYNGHPLKHRNNLGTEYGDTYVWTNGNEYALISTHVGDRLLILRADVEVEIDPKIRMEVETWHSQWLDKNPRVVGLHPNLALAVLLWKWGASDFLRYYGIDDQWGLVYLGSKDNINTRLWEKVVFCSVENDRAQKAEFVVLLWENGKGLAFMIWIHTCIPVLDSNNKPQLLICTIDTGSKNSWSLKIQWKVEIPERMIDETWKIIGNVDLSSVIEKFPWSDVIFSPADYAQWGLWFRDREGTEVHPQVISDIPVFAFGDIVYYLRGSTFWSPARWEKYQIPEVNLDSYDLGKWLTQVTMWENSVYILNKKITENDTVRFAIFLWKNGQLAWRYVWYDTEKWTIEAFKNGTWKSVEIREFLQISRKPWDQWDELTEARIAFEENGKLYLYDLHSRESIDIPELAWLVPYIDDQNSVWYHTPWTKHIVHFDKDNDTSPKIVKIEGNECYILSGAWVFPEWNPTLWSVESHEWDEVNLSLWSPQQVIHLYNPRTKTTAPHRVIDGQYVPVFKNIPNNTSVELSDWKTLIIGGHWSRENQWEILIPLETIARWAESISQEYIVDTIFYQSGEYALVRVQDFYTTVLSVSNDWKSKNNNEFFLMYKWGIESYLIRFPSDIVFIPGRFYDSKGSLKIWDYIYDLDKDAQLIDTWLRDFAGDLMPRSARDQVLETKGLVWTTLQG